MTVRWADPEYPSDRRVLMSGRLKVGAVFPPVGTPRDSLPWVWRLWVTGSTMSRDGRAKTELAAKTALLSAWREFLTSSGLQEVEG